MKIPPCIQYLYKPGTVLRYRVLSASFWTMTSRISTRLLSFVRIIVLARILSPEAFGLVAVGLLGIEFTRALTQTGFSTALIQKKEDIKSYLDTAWVMTIIRGFVMGICLFLLAPLIAGFFGSSDAKPIVQAMAILVIIDGFLNSGLVYLSKELDIKKRFILDISQTLAELAVAIPLAVILRNAWALVFGAVARHMTGLVLSYFIHSYRPKIRFDLLKAKELFNYGKWLTLSAWINYFVQNSDRIFVGRLIGVTSLGLYQMARRISDTYTLDIHVSTQDVALPTYAKMQDNTAKLRDTFLMSMGIMASLVFPLGFAVLILAPTFVPIVFGEQWVEAIPAMQILGIAAAFYCTLSLGKSLFFGLGHPRLSFQMTFVATIVMFGTFYPLHNYFGLRGIAIAVLIGNFCPMPILLFKSMQMLKIRLSSFLRIMIVPTVMSVTILVIGALAVRYITIQSEVFQLAVMFGIVGISALSTAFLFWKLFGLGPFQAMKLLK